MEHKNDKSSEFRRQKKSLKCQAKHIALTVNGHLVKPEGKYKCTKCSKTFTQETRCKFHMDNNKCRKVKVFQCKPCNKSFVYESYLVDHQQSLQCHKKRIAAGELTGEPQKHYMCSKCPTTFVHSSSVIRHEKRCKYQGDKRKDNAAKPKTNEKTHNVAKPKTNETVGKVCYGQNETADKVCYGRYAAKYQCKRCTKSFKTEKGWRFHQNDKCNPIKTPRYRCESCNKSYLFKSYLEHHLRTLPRQENRIAAGELSGEPQKFYKCSKCPKSFTRNGPLRTHEERCEYQENQKIDHLTKPNHIVQDGKFICMPCNKTLNSRSSFHGHWHGLECQLKRVAVGELTKVYQPFECPSCKRQFSIRKNMEKHQKSCESSKTRDEAKKDEITEAKKDEITEAKKAEIPEVKKYKCQKCPFSCNMTANMKRHVAGHNQPTKKTTGQDSNPPAKPRPLKFLCRWCAVIPLSQSAMIEHMKDVHDKEIRQGKVAASLDANFKLPEDPPARKCCYICLKRFRCSYITYEHIEMCETRIGLSMDGYVHPVFR